MIETSFASYLTVFMVNVGLLAGVPLAVGTACGLLISFFQAITQIQDQTLSQTIKITAISLILLGFGAVLTGPLIASTKELFENFHTIAN